MKNMPIEILEARIAPATFLVSGADKTVFKLGTGDVTADNATARTDSGADIAVLLSAGDSLVYDLNGDQLVSAGEPTLVKVAGGQAMAFFEDVNASNRFDLTEFTGLALSDGAKVTVIGNVQGPVVTALDANGAFVKTGTIGSITGSKITGTVFGNIFAGGSINGLTIKSAKDAAPNQPNVLGQVATGTAAEQFVSFDGGPTQNLLAFNAPAGSNGGDIVKLTLDRGAFAILAGDGIAGTTGGSGGSITDLKITNAVVTSQLSAGEGGAGTAGAGGKGGSVSGAKITLNVDIPSTAGILAGSGGFGTGGKGGDGGDVTKSSITSLLSLNDMLIESGAGGGSVANDGGNGGQVTDVKLSIFGGNFGGGVSVAGGEGGNVTTTGNGGAGGSVSGLVAKVIGDLNIGGGVGGSGGATSGKGGDGGSVIKSKINSDFAANTTIIGGEGGDGNGANAGAGGSLSGLSFSGTPFLQLGIQVFAGGAGGDVLTGNGTGGSGGSLSDLKLTNLNALDIQIAGGKGGDGFGSGAGGGGGTITGLSASSAAGGAWTVQSGNGGAGGATGNGGAGGSLVKANIVGTNATIAAAADIFSGNGGEGGSTSGAGGAGGKIDQLKTRFNLLQDFSAEAGDGGVGRGAAGGVGGSLTNSQFTFTGFVGALDVTSGSGGTVISGDGSGSKGGEILGLKVVLSGLNQGEIRSGTGGGGSGTGDGAAGGGLSGSSVVIQGNFGSIFQNLAINSGDGGTAGTIGKGGDGGELGSFKLSSGATPSTGFFVLGSGIGGDSAGAGQGGGNAGTVHDLTLNAATGTVILFSGAGGSAINTPAANGGNAGTISKISGKVGTLVVVGGDGGSSLAGTGGAGASLDGLNVSTARFAQLIAAGDGGSTGAGGIGGLGGSVKNVKVSGDIGDFLQKFDTSSPLNDMGGLVAGQGGKVNLVVDATRNGSIENVSARRIAAIIAGKDDGTSLSAANAVTAISGITTSIIGADVNNDRLFTFTDNGGTADFDLGTTDAAIDGLVIVKTGGFTGTFPTPLKLISV